VVPDLGPLFSLSYLRLAVGTMAEERGYLTNKRRNNANEQEDVDNMLAWCRRNGVSLLDMDEVFHSQPVLLEKIAKDRNGIFVTTQLAPNESACTCAKCAKNLKVLDVFPEGSVFAAQFRLLEATTNFGLHTQPWPIGCATRSRPFFARFRKFAMHHQCLPLAAKFFKNVDRHRGRGDTQRAVVAEAPTPVRARVWTRPKATGPPMIVDAVMHADGTMVIDLVAAPETPPQQQQQEAPFLKRKHSDADNEAARALKKPRTDGSVDAPPTAVEGVVVVVEDEDLAASQKRKRDVEEPEADVESESEAGAERPSKKRRQDTSSSDDPMSIDDAGVPAPLAQPVRTPESVRLELVGKNAGFDTPLHEEYDMMLPPSAESSFPSALLRIEVTQGSPLFREGLGPLSQRGNFATQLVASMGELATKMGEAMAAKFADRLDVSGADQKLFDLLALPTPSFYNTDAGRVTKVRHHPLHTPLSLVLSPNAVVAVMVESDERVALALTTTAEQASSERVALWTDKRRYDFDDAEKKFCLGPGIHVLHAWAGNSVDVEVCAVLDATGYNKELEKHPTVSVVALSDGLGNVVSPDLALAVPYGECAYNHEAHMLRLTAPPAPPPSPPFEPLPIASFPPTAGDDVLMNEMTGWHGDHDAMAEKAREVRAAKEAQLNYDIGSGLVKVRPLPEGPGFVLEAADMHHLISFFDGTLVINFEYVMKFDRVEGNLMPHPGVPTAFKTELENWNKINDFPDCLLAIDEIEHFGAQYFGVVVKDHVYGPADRKKKITFRIGLKKSSTEIIPDPPPAPEWSASTLLYS
jgi:hypothetical protein